VSDAVEERAAQVKRTKKIDQLYYYHHDCFATQCVCVVSKPDAMRS
jgi:hypothetical protein